MSCANRWLLFASLLLAAALGLLLTKSGLPQTAASPQGSAPVPEPVKPVSAPVTGSSPTPAERGTQQAPREGVNAANFYAEAFGLLEGLSEDDIKLLDKKPSELDPETLKALFEKIQPIVARLAMAADANYCEWGIESSWNNPHPIINGLRFLAKKYDPPPPMSVGEKIDLLAKVARWNAALIFPDNPSGAISCLDALSTLGHHVSSIPLDGAYESASISWLINATIAEHVASLNDATYGKALALIKADRFSQDIRRGIRLDGETRADWIREVASQPFKEQTESLGKAATRSLLGDELGQASWGTGEHKTDSARQEKERLAAMQRLISNPEAVAEEIRFTKEVTAQLADHLTVPDSEYKQWETQVRASIEANHPLAQAIGLYCFPFFLSRFASQRNHMEASMLEAGLSVVRNGAESLNIYTDPLTGQDYDYVPANNGFLLRSKIGGEPFTMRFGSPK